MSTRQMFVLLLSSLGLISCKDKGPSEPQLMRTLVVVEGPGATGNKISGQYKYPDGQVVPYAFRARTGNQNLIVEIGNAIVPPSGDITMSSDKLLFAIADSIIVLDPKAEPLKTDAVRYMVASDSASAVSAYATYATDLANLLSSDPTNGKALALVANRKAFEQTPDAAIAKAAGFLSGRLFGPYAGLGSTAQGGAIDTSKVKISVIFVPGIFNQIDGGAISAKEIEKLAQEVGIASTAEVYYLYNSGPIFDPSEQCITRALVLSSLFSLNACGISDTVSLDKQISSILEKGNGTVLKESQALTQIITKERGRGRSVIVIGHSQGSIIAAEALQKIQPDGCISAISIAGVFGKNSWPSQIDLSGLVVGEGSARDIVLTLRQNDFNMLPTSLTSKADKLIESISNSDGRLARAFAVYMEGVDLHFMTSSYLAAQESRAAIGTLMSNASKTLLSKDYCSIGTGTRIYASDAPLNADGTVSGSSNLWIVNPRALGADTLVGPIRTKSGHGLLVTDVVDLPTGELLGVTPDTLYSIDKSSAVAVLVSALKNLPPPVPSNIAANALGFDVQGRFVLAGRGSQNIFAIRRDLLQLDVIGNFGADFTSAGDIAETPDSYMFAIGENAAHTDYLLSINGPVIPATPVGGPIGFSNVWGLNAIGTNLLGFTSDSLTHKGYLISLDRKTGKGSLVRALSFGATGAGAHR